MSSPWIFTQLEAPEGRQRETLKLEGHLAPHGRPRKGPVVSNGIRVRQSETYYTGNDAPTRHVWGLRQEPFALHGRFSDGYGGKGVAKAKDNEVRRFVAQRMPVSIVWGDRINARGLIEFYEGDWESDGEIVWQMTIAIDRDLTIAEVRRQLTQAVAPRTRMEDLRRRIDKSLGDMGRPLPPTLRGSVFDAVSAYISVVAESGAALNDVVDQVGELSEAPFKLLRQLRAGISTFSTAIENLRGYYDQLTANVALESQEAREARQFWDVQAAWGSSSLAALRELAAMDRDANLASQSKVKTYYAATSGDTWESIATKQYGNSDRARAITEANGIEEGDPPVPGELYVIPR